MQQGPVQVTVIEYVNEFFKNYSKRAYGKTLLGNASKGAETLMGMLKLVLNRGGRDELRIALHCFKDQLTGAIHSPASVRQQQVDEVFALLSSLIDAAERLRQFSPVKEQLSTAVLEEVRFRLYRIIVGDGFCEDVDLRRRALDITFTAMMREAAEHERSLARINKLSCTGTSPAAAAATSTALVVAGQHNHAAGAAAAPAGPDAGAKGPGRLRGSFQRKAAALSGPDFSSWEGMWASLGSMAPKRMLPLLQAVMMDLYLGKMMAGTPGAAAAAGTAATGNGSTSSCGTAGTPRSASMPKQAVQVPPQQQQQQAERVQSAPLQQTHSQDLLRQQQQQGGVISLQQPHTQPQQSQQQPPQQQQELTVVEPSGSSREYVGSCSSSPNCSLARDDGVQVDADAAGVQQHEEQQQQQQQQIGPAVEAGPSSVAASSASEDTAPQQAQQPSVKQQQQQQQPSRFGRSSARPGHPIAAGYGSAPATAVTTPSNSSGSTPTAVATVSSINSSSCAAAAASGTCISNAASSSSPKSSGVTGETRGAFAALASRFSGGGSNKDKAASVDGANSPGSGGSKWGNLAGGFLGLQSNSNGVVGSGRLIPRGWVQFGAHGSGSAQQQKGGGYGASKELSAESPGTPSNADADTYAAEGVVDARVQQAQQDQVSAAVEPCTPNKGASATAAAAAAGGPGTAGVVSETGMRHDNAGGESEHGFEQDEPDWGSGSSACCTLKAPASTAVHCTTAPASAAVRL